MNMVKFFSSIFVALALVFGLSTASFADEFDDFIKDYEKIVEMYEDLAEKDAPNEKDMNKFNESMMDLSQKASKLQSTGKQISERQTKQLSDLATRLGQVAQKLSAKMQ